MFLITSLLRYATCREIHPFRGRTQRCQDIHEVVQCHYSQFGCFNLRGFKGARSPLTDGAAGLQAVTPLSHWPRLAVRPGQARGRRCLLPPSEAARGPGTPRRPTRCAAGPRDSGSRSSFPSVVYAGGVPGSEQDEPGRSTRISATQSPARTGVISLSPGGKKRAFFFLTFFWEVTGRIQWPRVDFSIKRSEFTPCSATY